MYKRNEVILNERKYVEEILRTGDLGNKPSRSLNLAARFYNSEGLSEDDIRTELESLLLRYDKNASVVKWDDILSRAVKNSGKRELLEIDRIPITKLEMDICDSLKTKHTKLVMFTLFCFAKFEHYVNDKNFGWVDIAISYLFRSANVKTNSKRQADIIHDLYKRGYVNMSANVDSTSMQVVFMDLESLPVMYVDDFRDLGNQYLEYHGTPHVRCSVCGSLVKKTSNCQIYCKKCRNQSNRKRNVMFRA